MTEDRARAFRRALLDSVEARFPQETPKLAEIVVPPGGGGWTCKEIASVAGGDRYECKKTETHNDLPPGGGHWACVKGSELGGTKCFEVETPPPFPAPPVPGVGGKCVPNSRRWCGCDTYCGWGQVRCLPSGKWETEVYQGKERIKCTALGDKRRPATQCGCYHTFFNPQCCERQDCVVPAGKNGQLCKPGPGKLCDPCDPVSPKCSGAGALCLAIHKKVGTATTFETVCGAPCSATGGCPAGYTCVSVKQKAGTSHQCVPADNSCYF